MIHVMIHAMGSRKYSCMFRRLVLHKILQTQIQNNIKRENVNMPICTEDLVSFFFLLTMITDI